MTSPVDSQPKLTLAEKVWRDHVVTHGTGDEPDLIFIDLQLLHEVTSPQAFDGLRLVGRTLRHPELHLATEDHNVPTTGIKTGDLTEIADSISRTQVSTLRKTAKNSGYASTPWGTSTKASSTRSAPNSAPPNPA